MTKLTSAIIIAVSILLFSIFTLPNYDSIKVLKEEIAVRRDILSDRESLIKKIENLNKAYQENITDVSKLSQLIPKDKELAEITSAIDDMVRKSGASLEGMKFSVRRGRGEEKINRIVADVRISGSYESLTSLLEMIEQSIRIFDPLSIVVALQGQKDDMLDIKLDLATYYLKGEEKK